jgi:hypothetical protein
MRDSELEAVESVELLADDLRRASENGRQFVFGPLAAAELVDVLNEVAKMARRLPDGESPVADENQAEGFVEEGRKVVGDAPS